MRNQHPEKTPCEKLAQVSDLTDSPANNGEHVLASYTGGDSTQASKCEDVVLIDNAHLSENSDVTCEGDSHSRKRSAEESVADAAESVKRPREEIAGGDMTEKLEPKGDKDASARGPVELAILEHTASSVSLAEVNGDKHENTEQPGIARQSQPSVSSESKAEGDSAVHADSSPKEYVLKCVMRLKPVDKQIQLELEYLGGQSRELMYQVFTFLKNKLTQSVK